MCKPQYEKSSDVQKAQIPWTSIVCPCIAGLLHLHVFYVSAFYFVFPAYLRLESLTEGSRENGAGFCYLLDRAVILAYTFDLICCYCFKVIPFSRCNSPMDIVGHHLPILFVFMPLGAHIWAGTKWVEPMHFTIMDLEIGSKYRSRLIEAGMKANGFGFISSLNEAIMCFQRAEMSFQRVESFRGIPQMKNRFFTSRIVIGVELYYKLCIFWVFSTFACKASTALDKTYFDYITEISLDEKSLWSTILSTIKNACVIRSILFRVFVLAMYPSMGMRTLKKIKQFHLEGRLCTNLQ